MRYMVEFNFENGIAMNIKTGFNTYDEAQDWVRDNAQDGKILTVYSSAYLAQDKLGRR